MAEQVKITLIKSTIGCLKFQKDTVAALGLKKINQFKVCEMNDTVAGMIRKVNHLVKVEKI